MTDLAAPPQQSPQFHTGLLQEFKRKAAASYDAMLARINDSPDPSVGFEDRVYHAALNAWNAALAQTNDCRVECNVNLSRDELGPALCTADEQTRDAFYETLCEELYDTKTILQETNMEHLLEPQEAVSRLVKEFYEGLLNATGQCDGLVAQRTTPLEAVALKEVAAASKRVAVGNGLPGDGHVVHSMLQGQAAFQNRGKEGCVTIQAVAQSESTWNVADSSLPLVVEGGSTAGKGNAKHVLLGWLSHVAKSGASPSCTNVLKQGNLTVNGVLASLIANDMQCQIVNEELEKVICCRKRSKLQESDLIEFLDGSDAFGKGNDNYNLCCKPDGWMFVGAQRDIYLRDLGSGQGSNGRLRGQCLEGSWRYIAGGLCR